MRRFKSARDGDAIVTAVVTHETHDCKRGGTQGRIQEMLSKCERLFFFFKGVRQNNSKEEKRRRKEKE